MKVARTFSSVGRLTGFEIPSVEIRRHEVVDLLQCQPGILIIDFEKQLQGVRCCNFKLRGNDGHLSEWWNDSSDFTFYCPTAKPEEIEEIAVNFELWHPPRLRVFGFKLWTWFSVALVIFATACALYQMAK